MNKTKQMNIIYIYIYTYIVLYCLIYDLHGDLMTFNSHEISSVPGRRGQGWEPQRSVVFCVAIELSESMENP